MMMMSSMFAHRAFWAGRRRTKSRSTGTMAPRTCRVYQRTLTRIVVVRHLTTRRHVPMSITSWHCVRRRVMMVVVAAILFLLDLMPATTGMSRAEMLMRPAGWLDIILVPSPRSIVVRVDHLILASSVGAPGRVLPGHGVTLRLGMLCKRYVAVRHVFFVFPVLLSFALILAFFESGSLFFPLQAPLPLSRRGPFQLLSFLSQVSFNPSCFCLLGNESILFVDEPAFYDDGPKD
ncbi:hypothetical protein IE53DRAFT_97360 [Violaceomyces palustris]|uniref:Uncharacterized protein n=1 Tax=Violaceomyces palustris TaxID=1673888 RepID=A0ACD0NX76_9BASI|nr:hypothetical protein IE53DRAFT_97360 [Violaceomyces palustris]